VLCFGTPLDDHTVKKEKKMSGNKTSKAMQVFLKQGKHVDRCMGIGFAHYYYTEHIYGLTITT
jgi:hypothetical protein